MGCRFYFIFPDALKQNTSYAGYHGGSVQLSPELGGHGHCSVLKHGCLQHCKTCRYIERVMHNEHAELVKIHFSGYMDKLVSELKLGPIADDHKSARGRL